MKEYSKSALRRHKQSEQLRERRTARRRGPTKPRGDAVLEVPVSKEDDPSNPMNLIRREIAIMKKLDHPNIVTLVEVLDDPHGDSLYMILEWCGKGAIIPVSWDDDDEQDENISSGTEGLGSRYSEEECRLFFRDMILGIEYLHSQGVIHRDIKADNLLLDEDDVVKIADFGVSEILDPANDTITKNAGSPAYMAPELAAMSSHTALKEHAATKGISVSSLSGKSTDIWSMGVTLYVLLFGKLPFRSSNMVDLFDKIVNDDIYLPEGTDPSLVDLFSKILAKAPKDRINMDELRKHSWVTLNHEDNLLSREENTADNITPVTEEDLYCAIEFVQGFMEPNQALAKLRRLHGFRGYATNINSNTNSSSSTSLSPPSAPAETRRSPSPLDETISLYKLTRALEEIVSKSSGYIHKYSNTLQSSLNDKPNSISISSVAPVSTVHILETVITASTTSMIAQTPKNEDKQNIFDVTFEEPLEEPSGVSPPVISTSNLVRKPSRTHARQVIGLENLTSVRSRSLDPETRL